MGENIFDRIRKETRCRLDDELAVTKARVREIESHQRIKESLGYHGTWRDVIRTVVQTREARGFFYAADIETAASEAAESVMMVGGSSADAIDAIEREMIRSEFRFSGSDNPCDEIMPLDYGGWSRGEAGLQ